MLDTLPYLINTDFPHIKRGSLSTLQVNLGYMCNQQCLHCHVDASPKRTEIMTLDTINLIIKFMENNSGITTLDLTGGAPEMNPNFKYLVTAAKALNIEVIDRCNLTILEEDDQKGLLDFLVENQVHVVASMPCYIEDNVDAQRGKGVFSDSIKVLKKMNSAGYGKPGSHLQLDLVYNPQGASLPPSQCELEKDYHRELKDRFNVFFNHLLVITNMPIKRFGSMLLSKGTFKKYMGLLKQSHKPENVQSVMCRSLISVDWQGYIYDCDFNQMLDIPLGMLKKKTHLSDLDYSSLEKSTIAIAEHCYGCTAGQGSSCGGSLESNI